ncbi:hypothetical protein X946_2788 [Burkholderia sp. ABCPW 111]|nr:hypothetical protein X946_2788 [Burkholderia sp. ABCPW 111]
MQSLFLLQPSFYRFIVDSYQYLKVCLRSI